MTTPHLRTPVTSVRTEPRPHTKAAWMVTYALFSLLLGGTVPTPLYSVYAARLSLSPLMVSCVFGVMAAGALTALLLFGTVSEQIGRRATIMAAALLALCSCAVFATTPTLTGLFTARILTGLSIGLSNGAATAYLAELLGDRRRAALTSSVANMLGLGTGPLLAGALVQYAPHRLVTSYVVLGVLLLPGFVLLALPETVRREGPMRIRPQRLAVPAEMRSVFTAMAVAVFGSFSVLGLVAALVGKFLVVGLHDTNHLMVGVVAFSAFGAAGLTQVLAAGVAPRTGAVAGMVAVPVGLALYVEALPQASMTLFLTGAVIAGAGSGLAFRAGLTMVSALAPPDRVTQVVSSYFASAYSALAIPVIGIGILVTHMSLLRSAVIFAIAVSLLAVLSISVTVATRPRPGGGLAAND